MAWAPIAAATIPIVYDMFRQKPGAPNLNFPGGGVMPDRSAYVQQLLDSAYNPQSNLYQLAIDRARQNISRDLARRGILGSAGEDQRAAAMTMLGNRFLETETARRAQALQAANAYDSARAGNAINIGNMMNENAWRSAGLQEQRDQAMIRNIGGLAGAGANYFTKQDERAQLDAQRLQDQENFNRYMSAFEGRQAQSGGTYYYPGMGLGQSKNPGQGER
jgi:hypothetical protein